MVSAIWQKDDVEASKKLLLEYIQHAKLNSRSHLMTVYHPVLAFFVNCLGTISSRLLELAKIAPERRRTSLHALQGSQENRKSSEMHTKHVCQNNNDIPVPFNVALRASNIEVVAIGNNIITLYCQNCGQSYSCSPDRAESCLADHLLSQSHWRRHLLMRENQLGTTRHQ